MIFLGNGEFSKLEVEELHGDLDNAIYWLGLLQQPSHSENYLEDINASKLMLKASIDKILGKLGYFEDKIE